MTVPPVYTASVFGYCSNARDGIARRERHPWRGCESGALPDRFGYVGWGKGDLWGERVGPHVWRDQVPLKRLLRAGLVVGAGSDWGPKNPWEQMQLAETHEFAASGHRNATPDHAVTRDEAIVMWTRDAGRVLGWDGVGTLAPGSHADVIVVDRDPLTRRLDELPETSVLLTLLGGRVVHDGGKLDTRGA